MKNENKKEIKKSCHAEKLLLSISRLLSGCFTTTNNPKKGGPEQKHLRTTTCFNNGFTLIELLVVVLIIGILAAIAVPQYQAAVGKARFMQLIVLGDAIQKAEEVYYLANNEYTSDLTKLDLDLSNRPSNVNMSVTVKNDAVATMKLPSTPEYVVYFNHHPSKTFQGRRECRVNDGNSTAKKICANVTGSREYPGDSYSFWIF